MSYFFKLFFFVFFFNNLYAEVSVHDFKKYKVVAEKLKLKEVVKGLNHPWGLTFIDEENLIVTEKNGGLLKININSKKVTKIKHKINSIPFDGSDQGGLLDVLYDNGFLYFSYSHQFENTKTSKKLYSTAISRGKLIDNEIKNLELLLLGKPKLSKNIHWGSRIVINKNLLYAGFGERGLGMIAQDPSKHPGSIIRINIDGSIPKDNPHHTNKPNWLPEIYQIGVRNPQGMAISPKNKKIYFSQHGPRGGDNIGILKKSGNYGWKVVAWGGTEYYGAKIGTEPFKKKYDLPIISWVPSIGVGQINFYSGNTFPEWDGNLIVSATKAGLLFRLVLENDKVVEQEIILNNEIGRIRDFEVGANGDIFLIVDDNDSSLWHLSR
jgi:quinoprotein glucose dehydrogenase